MEQAGTKAVNFTMSKELADAKAIKYASWVIAPSVQELAKTATELPSQYIRPDRDSPAIPECTEFAEVPVIDFQKLGHEDSELEKLDLACKEWGFFQVTNHGIDVEKFKMEVKNFFGLPYEEKRRLDLWQHPENKEGFGQHFVSTKDDKQLDWSDMFFINALPHVMRSDIFYRLPPIFRETLEAYSLAVKKLAMELLCQMAGALKMDEKEIFELFADGVQSIRMNYYPPCPEPDKAIGLTCHSDAVGLTLLLQLNETPGLQIKKDGKWLPVKPIPNAFIANIGDIMEIVTNGIYQSIEHRAMVNSEKERYSVAAFFSCQLHTVLGPSRNLISPSNPPIFKNVPIVTYYKEFFSKKPDGKSYLDVFRVNNEGCV